MATITKLDQSTINQIAAGEVIDRPSSVVKELLENAIDAGATAVTIEIRGGGISLVRVTDNGCGMEAEEIPLAFLRHTTSKIRSVEDLLTVRSLGFRGEALSSIAAVAQVELITKNASSLTGCRYVIEGGEEKRQEEVGAPEGTTILVRNLFYHTPARKKFLKSAATEGAYISDLVQRMALSHPEISLRLIVENQTRLHTAGNHNLRDIIYAVYGRELTRELVLAEGELFCGRVEGYIGKPAVSKGNRSWENYFINGRYIKSNLIGKALEEAYSGLMMQRKYPFCALHFYIDPDMIDVNVHPSKMEIRFQEAERLYQEVLEVIRDALKGQQMIPAFSVGEPEKKEKSPAALRREPEPFERYRMLAEAFGHASKPGYETGHTLSSEGMKRPEEVKQPEQKTEAVPVGTDEMPDVTEKHDTIREDGSYGLDHTPVAENVRQQELFADQILQKRFLDDFRIIGQLFQTYWLVQYQDTFLIIDQHAAHEKVLFEKLVRDFRERTVMTQQMNPPFILTLSAAEEVLIQTYAAFLKDAGFEIESFGGSEYAVYAMPVELYRVDGQTLLKEIIDGLSQMRGSRESGLIFEQIATRACKSAIKGNQKISQKEMEALLERLLELENPYTCPHGRPVMIRMTRYELEKTFKRVIS